MDPRIHDRQCVLRPGLDQREQAVLVRMRRDLDLGKARVLQRCCDILRQAQVPHLGQSIAEALRCRQRQQGLAGAPRIVQRHIDLAGTESLAGLLWQLRHSLGLVAQPHRNLVASSGESCRQTVLVVLSCRQQNPVACRQTCQYQPRQRLLVARGRGHIRETRIAQGLCRPVPHREHRQVSGQAGRRRRQARRAVLAGDQQRRKASARTGLSRQDNLEQRGRQRWLAHRGQRRQRATGSRLRPCNESAHLSPSTGSTSGLAESPFLRNLSGVDTRRRARPQRMAKVIAKAHRVDHRPAALAFGNARAIRRQD